MRTASYFRFLSVMCSALSFFEADGQVTVTGPGCVIPGITYQYLISGPWDSASTMQVCLTGGSVAGSGASCTANGTPVAAVLVMWSGTGTGIVRVSSSKGNGSLSVTVGSVLAGGTIGSTVKTQSIAFKGIPAVIACSAPTGGSCLPAYQLQWQQSADQLKWTDIAGARGLTLSFGQPLQQATFFRRKVTETVSGTIAYSDIAVVDVSAPPPASSSN